MGPIALQSILTVSLETIQDEAKKARYGNGDLIKEFVFEWGCQEYFCRFYFLISSSTAGSGNALWSILWFVIMILIGFIWSGFCAGFYILLSALLPCIPALRPTTDFLYNGIDFVNFCSKNIRPSTRVAHEGNPAWAVFWVVILIFAGLLWSAFCAFFYILFSSLTPCLPGLKETTDYLHGGINFVKYCSRNVVERRPLC